MAVEVGGFGLLGRAWFGGGYERWRHKIFEAGSYPRQGVEADEAYLDRLVQNFRPVKLKNSHLNDPQSIFSRLDLGGCDRIWREGAELFGEGRVHSVVRMISDEPRASIEIENHREDPTLSAIALLNFPQVTDAAVFACFAGARHSAADMELLGRCHDAAVGLGASCGGSFEGARHSEADMADVQQLHDLTVKLGASCIGVFGGDMDLSIWDKLKAFFGASKPEELKRFGLTAEDVSEPSSESVDSQLSARFAAMAEGNLKARAAQFAADWKTRRKITPAEEAGVAQLYMMAAKADGDGKVASFGADGAVVEGSNVATLCATMEARRTLALFETEIKNEAILGIGGDREALARQALNASVGAYNKGGF